MIGKAYAFFDCPAPKAIIKAELPGLQTSVGTPSELEVKVLDDPAHLRGDAEILGLAQEIQAHGIKYILEGAYPSHSHQQTAQELAGILNQVSLLPALFPRKEPFFGWIFYKDTLGHYVEWE